MDGHRTRSDESGDSGCANWPAEIRRFRLLHAMKQANLAEILGVDQATVSRWESGFSIPELGMQRRLRDMIFRSAPDKALVRHWVSIAPAQVQLSTPERKAIAASASYCAVHGVRQDQIVGMDMTPTHSEDSRRMWSIIRDNGFYRGEIASAMVIVHSNSLAGLFHNVPVKVVYTPVRLARGMTLLRSERVPLTETEYPATLLANGGPIRMQPMDTLVG